MGRWNNGAILLAVLLSKAADISALTKPIQLTSNRVTIGNQWDSALSASTPITKIDGESSNMDGETSRPFRRTVYTHDNWVSHRSSTRFVRNFKTLFSSVIYKSVGKEVFTTTLVASFVCVWNVIAGGYTDLAGFEQPPIIDGLPLLGLPLTPFTLVTPSLGLLLVFRTNTSYQRWDEARKNWGMNINHTRDLMRMGVAFYGHGMPPESIDLEKRQKDLNELSLCTWAFVRSMKRHLSPVAEDEEDFKAELREKLSKEQAEGIIAAAHRPNRALSDLSNAIEVLPMNFLRKNQMHTALTIFEDNLGSSERILSSPVPIFYSRHTARFLLLFLLLVPFALWEPFQGSWNHLAMIPAQASIAVGLFGIDELATQLEEPFTILPMQGFCDKIGNWCNEIATWPSPKRRFTAAQLNNIAASNKYDSSFSTVKEIDGNVSKKDKYDANGSTPIVASGREENEYEKQYKKFVSKESERTRAKKYFMSFAEFWTRKFKRFPKF